MAKDSPAPTLRRRQWKRRAESLSRERWLRWLLRLGYGAISPSSEVRRPNGQIEAFVKAALNRPFLMVSKVLSAADIREAQSQALHALRETAAGRGYDLPVSLGVELAIDAGRLSFKGGLPELFKLTLAEFLSGPAHHMVSHCPRCNRLFMRTRHSKYCGARCARKAEAAQARARRAKTPIDEKYEQRHQAYERAWKRKHPGSRAKIISRGPRKAADVSPPKGEHK